MYAEGEGLTSRTHGADSGTLISGGSDSGALVGGGSESSSGILVAGPHIVSNGGGGTDSGEASRRGCQSR